jgi:uncharacterized protein YdhG (YjbR/CyaY superfamily)
MDNKKPDTIDGYIAAFPEATQVILKQIRQVIAEEAPEAQECISYGIPTFKLANKAVVHFAAFKNHIGLYATPSGHKAFEPELSGYKQGKGSVQFPIDQPLPLDLIAQITAYRKTEIQTKSQ